MVRSALYKKEGSLRAESRGCWKADVGPVALTLSRASQLLTSCQFHSGLYPLDPLKPPSHQEEGCDLGSVTCPRKPGRGDCSSDTAAHAWGGGSVSWTEGLGWLWQSS